MKTSFRKTIAAILAVVMCLSMMPAGVFAGEDESTESTKNLLVFGDSTSSGYGLPDFDFTHNSFNINNNDLTKWTPELAEGKGRISNFSHPWQLKEYIAEKEFGGELSKVNLSSMCLGGMRTDELRALLDDEYFQRVMAHEFEVTANAGHVGFLTDHMRDYVNALRDGGAKVGGHEIRSFDEGGLADAQAYTEAEVKKANVIVVDVCTNNFGTYLARRIAGKMHTPNFEDAYKYYLETTDDIDDLSDETKAEIKKLRALFLRLLKANGSDPDDMMTQFIDGLMYCYASCITNFTADMETLRRLNPNAKIIVVGIFNSLHGIKLSIDGRDLDFSTIGNTMFNSVNMYIKALDKNCDQYYFADLSGGLESFVDAAAKMETLEDLDATDDGRHYMDVMVRELTNTFLGRVTLTESQSAKARQLLFEASKFDRADLNDLIGAFGNPTAVAEDLQRYILWDAVEYPQDNSMALLNMELRFLFDYGIGQHPSKYGCLQKAASVKKAYDSETVAYDETKEQFAEKFAELREMLKGTPSGEELDRIIEILEEVDAALPMLDEAQMRLDEIQAIKAQFFEYYGQALDALGITEEELIEQGRNIAENTDWEQVAEWIRKMNDLVEDYPELREKYEPQIREYAEKIYEIVNAAMDEIIKAKDKIDVDKIEEYIQTVEEIVDKIRDIVKNAPSEEQIREQLEELRKIVEEKLKEISDELYEQLKAISDKINEVVDGRDYEQIIEDLKPIMEQLKEMGVAVYKLPEYVKIIDSYTVIIEQLGVDSAELWDEIEGLRQEVDDLQQMSDDKKALIAKLRAKAVNADIKTAVKFPKSTVTVTASWEKDADATGYELTVNGKPAEFKETEAGFVYTDTAAKIGKTYKFEVTPYVEYEGEKISGKTFKASVVPKVKLKKPAIKKLKAGKKSFTVKWKKVSGASGYQVSYKLGKKTRYKAVKGAKKVSKKVKKLQSGKKYTVKVRAWKKVNGKKYYGKWSKAKKAKAK